MLLHRGSGLDPGIWETRLHLQPHPGSLLTLSLPRPCRLQWPSLDESVTSGDVHRVASVSSSSRPASSAVVVVAGRRAGAECAAATTLTQRPRHQHPVPSGRPGRGGGHTVWATVQATELSAPSHGTTSSPPPGHSPPLPTWQGQGQSGQGWQAGPEVHRRQPPGGHQAESLCQARSGGQLRGPLYHSPTYFLYSLRLFCSSAVGRPPAPEHGPGGAGGYGGTLLPWSEQMAIPGTYTDFWAKGQTPTERQFTHL